MGVCLVILLFSLAVLAGIIFLIGRGLRPLGDAVSVGIAVTAIFSATMLIYVTHTGKQVGMAAMALLAIMKAGERNKSIDFSMFSLEPYSTILFMSFIYVNVLLLIYAFQKLPQCFGTVVAVGEKGVYLRYFSKRWIPWSYVERIEEFTEYGEPAFRLILKTREHLSPRFLRSLCEKHPSISTQVINFRPAQLRDALYTHGKDLGL